MEISARTRFTAVFGDPVEHSLSPTMHNAAYAAAGMERAYLAFHVTAADLHDAIRALPALKIAGVNLTVPHKEAAVRLMDTLSEEALILGAVNCVINRDGELHGDNTDARGLERDLRQAGIMSGVRMVLVVGAGGAAASAVLACTRIGVTRILVCNRTIDRATNLARRLSHLGQGMNRTSLDSSGLDTLTDPNVLGHVGLMINATPIGLNNSSFAPLAYEATPADCVFYDMVYAREATPFLASARARHRRAVDGAGMLLNQGALAFELFNNISAPIAAMHRALMSALGRA
ncbi:MAG: shikimate dehydrogenase [Deltaproteobacteria bacterium]|nr:shikimate dehydrogenase [Deltaproteobacteria bacterium]